MNKPCKNCNKEIFYYDSLEDSVRESDVLLLLTSWPEFEKIPNLLKSLNINPLVVDGRRMLSKSKILNYEGIGI